MRRGQHHIEESDGGEHGNPGYLVVADPREQRGVYGREPFTAVLPRLAAEQRIPELWQSSNVAAADAFNGPWGAKRAPDPNATYTFVAAKAHGVSPGMTVRDPNAVVLERPSGDHGGARAQR